MRIVLIILTVFAFTSSCDFHEEVRKSIDINEFIEYDKNTGKLTVDIEKAKGSKVKINGVVLSNNEKNTTQNLILNDGIIERMENIKNVDFDKKYVNTWMEFDKQGNLIYDQSYYFETFLDQNDTSVFIECFLNNSFFHDEIYAVVGNYSKEFILNMDYPIDTIYFDKKRKSLRIPLAKYKKGENNIRFILYDDTFENGETKRRMSFVDKEFYIK